MKRISDIESEKGGVVLYVDDDWLEVCVDFKPGVTREAVEMILEKRGITQGLDQNAISVGLSRGANSSVEGLCIARGMAPKNGSDGKIEFEIDMNPKKVEVKDASGRVDYRDTNLIRLVKQGQRLLHIVPPGLGEEGFSVRGHKLRTTPGKKARIYPGKNITEQGEYLYAAIDGHVEVLDEYVSVSDTFSVKGDVDFKVGDINFIGAIIVEGSVREGFTLQSQKDIQIGGQAYGCTLVAEGNIEVIQGIHGGGKGHIKCKGTLTTRFINEANVEADKGIKVYKEIVRSTLRTMGRLDIEFGDIRGGDIKAYEGVVAREIGSPLGTKTLVAVGEDLTVDGKIAALKQATEELEPEKKKLQDAIGPFMKNKLLLVKATPDKQKAVEGCLKRIEYLNKRAEQIDNKIQEFEAARYARDKTIVVKGSLVQDVEVAIGKKRRKFIDVQGRSGTICYDKSSFEIVMVR